MYSPIYKQRCKTNRSELLYTGIWGLALIFESFMYFKQSWSSSSPWVSSTSSNNFKPLARAIKSRCNFSSLVHKKNTNLLQGQQLRRGVIKNYISQKFSRENVLWTKRPLKLVLCYSRPNTKQKLLKNPDSNDTLIQPKLTAPQRISQKLSNYIGISCLGGSKLINQNLLYQKKPKCCNFLGLKAFWQTK